MMVAILDACVLYPAPLRDFLLSLAELRLFQVKWTNYIQNEWTQNLMKRRPDLSDKNLANTINCMNNAFPDANIVGFDKIIDKLNLPDPNDRHVLAAAIKSKADFIITFNLKDFPSEYLKDFNIKAIHPDAFVYDLIKTASWKVMEALHNQVKRLNNPPFSLNEVLFHLKNCGLKESVKIVDPNV
jgi:predicted nucleic acid-binding protein